MPELERYFSREKMTPQTFPRVPAKQLADVGGELEAEALAGVGKKLDYASEIVAKWYEREGNTQFDTARRAAREKVNEFELTSFESADAHDKEYKKLRANIKKFAPKNKTGARKFQSWLDWASPIMDRRSDELKIRMIKRNNTIEYFRNISALATETDFDKAQDEARLLTQGAVDDKIRTPAQADSDFNKAMSDWLKTSVWNAAIKQATIDDQVIWGQVLSYLNQPKNTKGLPGDAVDSLVENAQTQHRIQTAITDQPTYADLYTKALDIWRGAISKEEFDQEIGKALNAGNLSPPDYQELAKKAASTLKASQAEALSRADSEAGRLIVDYRDEDVFAKFISDSIKCLKPDIATLFQDEANKRRKLQFWYLSQYNKEMRDWITENPDKIGKDFFQFSEQLKHEYWNTSINEIEKRKLRRDVELAKPEKSETIIMLSPEGKKFSVPVEKKQLFIDNGYTLQ